MENKGEIFIVDYLPRLLSGLGLFLTFYFTLPGLAVQLIGLVLSIIFFTTKNGKKRELIFCSLTLLISIIIVILAIVVNSRTA